MNTKLKIGCLLLLLLFVYYLCKEKKSAFEHSVPRNETSCLRRIELAKKDIREGRLTFCDTVDDYYSRYDREDKEKTELLEKYNITYGRTSFYPRYYEECLDKDVNCYCTFMREKIDEKYGSHFIDSIMDAADELFVQRNIDARFGEKMCDVRPVYPDDTETKNGLSFAFSKDLKNLLVHSVGLYKSKNEDNRGYIDIWINVDKDGTANIHDYILTLRNDSALKYEAYLGSQLERIVKKTGWTPGKIRGQKVYSIREIEFLFDYSGLKKENEEIELLPASILKSYRPWK